MLRELAERTQDGLTVTLAWDVDDDVVILHLVDHGMTATSTVPSDRALDAFYHPFVYLPALSPTPQSIAADVEEQQDDDPAAAIA